MAEEMVEQGATAPRLARELAEFREKVRAGTHQGDSFELTVTDTELEETLAWYSARHAGVPLPETRISIDSEGIGLSGEVQLGGLRAEVAGRADVYLQDGIPTLSIVELKMGTAVLPEFVRLQIEEQLNRQLMLREDELPVIVEELELEEGRLTIRGLIR
jgi:hypothetical protein